MSLLIDGWLWEKKMWGADGKTLSEIDALILVRSEDLGISWLGSARQIYFQILPIFNWKVPKDVRKMVVLGTFQT